MQVASISIKRTLSSRHISALPQSNILSWLFSICGLLFSATVNKLVSFLPTNLLFEIVGQLRLLLSFIDGLAAMKPAHTQPKLRRSVVSISKRDLFPQ